VVLRNSCSFLVHSVEYLITMCFRSCSAGIKLGEFTAVFIVHNWGMSPRATYLHIWWNASAEQSKIRSLCRQEG